MTDKSLTLIEGESITLTEARAHVLLQATWEIDALALAMPDLIEVTDDKSSRLHHLVRGMAARIIQLNGAILSGIGDDLVPLKTIHKDVLLTYPDAGEADA